MRRDERVGALAEDEEEVALLREVEVLDEDHEGPRYRSVRARRHALAAEGQGDFAPGGSPPGSGFWQLNPVLWYTLWHTESSSELSSHRNPSVSTGSTAGFSAGGFSGAGSSGRF